MARLLTAVLALSFSYFSCEAQTIAFKKKGKLIREISIENLKKEFPAETLSVFEGHNKSAASYRGVSLKTVLEKVYGAGFEREVDEALFTCIDGYQPSVPLAKALKHRGFLAYEKTDGSSFTFVSETGATIEFGPLYLVWENIEDKKIKEDGVDLWPYQIASIDLITFKERFQNLIPPGKMSERAKRGFLAYRTYCMQCHKINGEGGSKGIELNYPASVTEYFKETWLTKYIADPASVRHGAIMPSFLKSHPHEGQSIANIVEYLRSVAKFKVAPKD